MPILTGRGFSKKKKQQQEKPDEEAVARDDCWPLLPGFAALDDETRRILVSYLSEPTFRSASKTEYQDEKKTIIKEIHTCVGVGFIETSCKDGVLLVSPELKKVFVFPFLGNSSLLTNIANSLSNSAGWPSDATVLRQTISSAEEASPYDLGLEIQQAHATALRQAFDNETPDIERVYFVEDLKCYYAWREQEHQRLLEDSFINAPDLSAYHKDCLRLCGSLHVYLHKHQELGHKTATMVKANPDGYDAAYATLSTLLEADGIRAVRFERRSRKHPPEEVIEQETKPEQQPSNCDLAYSALRDYLKQPEDYPSFFSSGQIPLEIVRSAFLNLRSLRQVGVEWVNFTPNMPLEKLLQNIAKLHTAIKISNADTLQLNLKEGSPFLQAVLLEKAVAEFKTEPSEPIYLTYNGQEDVSDIDSSWETPTAQENETPDPSDIGEGKNELPAKDAWSRARTIFERSKTILLPLLSGAAMGTYTFILSEYNQPLLQSYHDLSPMTVAATLLTGALASAFTSLYANETSRPASSEPKEPSFRAFAKGLCLGCVGAGLTLALFTSALTYKAKHSEAQAPQSPQPRQDHIHELYIDP